MEEPDVRRVLGAEREATVVRIMDLTGDFEEVVAASAGSNADDEHDPEGSTVAFERAQIAALLLEARTYLDDLDRALARLHDGSYGVCAHCGGVIAPERLSARPATRLCINCAAAVRPAGPNATA
jgi:DnaK suppressor protein